MTRVNKSDLEDEVRRLKATELGHQLRQEIPYELIEEWADVAGRNMNWIYDLEADQ